MSSLVDIVLDVAARELRIGQRKIPLLQLADHDFDALQANPNTRDVVGFPTVYREQDGKVQFWPSARFASTGDRAMISRRATLAFLGSLPLIGRAFADDGVALVAAEHSVAGGAPVGELNEGALEAALVELQTYAHAGETVTCENGHPICEFFETVVIGQMQDPARQLGNWRQDAPQVGAMPVPGCALCGAPFSDGSSYHFADGWRRGRPLRIAAHPTRVSFPS